jgi:phospholipase/lecithinase/hemolysin
VVAVLGRLLRHQAKPNGNGQNGSNYAAGGARVAVDSTGALGAVPSLATQVGNYLASTGGKADPNALYTVWGGANDLFAVAAGANPTTTIGTAVSTEVGLVGQLQGAAPATCWCQPARSRPDPELPRAGRRGAGHRHWRPPTTRPCSAA